MQNCCRFLSVYLEKNKKTFMKNEPFAIFLTVLLEEKENIIRGISPKSRPNAYFLSVLIVRRKIFSTFFLNYEPNAIFLYSLIVEAKKYPQKADHFKILTLIDKCKENHGKSERVYASRRGS